MFLVCFDCGEVSSNELPENTIIRGIVLCAQCAAWDENLLKHRFDKYVAENKTNNRWLCAVCKDPATGGIGETLLCDHCRNRRLLFGDTT